MSHRFWSGMVLAAALGLSGCLTTGAADPADADAGAGPVAATEPEPEVNEAVARARAEAEQANRQLDLDRQTVQYAAWQHVKAIAEMWAQLPEESFPGLHALVKQVETVRAEIEQGEAVMAGRIDPEALTTRNPAFWRALLETTPEDPVVPLFAEMLWASRGIFDRSIWLIELHRYGPALPPPVHRLVYTLGEEMQRLRARQQTRRNTLLENLPPEEIARAVAAARTFQPENPDWALSGIVVRLQLGGVRMDDMEADAERVNGLLAQMKEDWAVVARNHPMLGARLDPDPAVRAAARELAGQLDELEQSRGAYGSRDLNRLSERLAEAGLHTEALLASRRSVALRGFGVPGDFGRWWQWLPILIGETETQALRASLEAGEINPVAFFEASAQPEGLNLLPLHPIVADRSLRRLQEVERRLAKPDLQDDEKAGALLTLAETLGHLGRWDEAEAALAAVPETLQARAASMRVWLALWSGRTQGIAEQVAAIDPEEFRTAPALPALAAAAQGKWQDGVALFETSARLEDVDLEYRTYYTLMASAFARLAGDEARADALIGQAREMGAGLEWVSVLVRGMAGEAGDEPVGSDVTEIVEAGRVCEQRFYRAFQSGLSPARQQALLEGCVATGVVDFVEYTASLIRLRELDPKRWDPAQVPTPVETETEPEGEERDDWRRGASPSWSIPS